MAEDLFKPRLPIDVFSGKDARNEIVFTNLVALIVTIYLAGEERILGAVNNAQSMRGQEIATSPLLMRPGHMTICARDGRGDGASSLTLEDTVTA